MKKEQTIDHGVIKFNEWFMGNNSPAYLFLQLREAYLAGYKEGGLMKKKSAKKPAKPVKK